MRENALGFSERDVEFGFAVPKLFRLEKVGQVGPRVLPIANAICVAMSWIDEGRCRMGIRLTFR